MFAVTWALFFPKYDHFLSVRRTRQSGVLCQKKNQIAREYAKIARVNTFPPHGQKSGGVFRNLMVCCVVMRMRAVVWRAWEPYRWAAHSAMWANLSVQCDQNLSVQCERQTMWQDTPGEVIQNVSCTERRRQCSDPCNKRRRWHSFTHATLAICTVQCNASMQRFNAMPVQYIARSMHADGTECHFDKLLVEAMPVREKGSCD